MLTWLAIEPGYLLYCLFVRSDYSSQREQRYRKEMPYLDRYRKFFLR
jgi:hypothetical protein